MAKFIVGYTIQGEIIVDARNADHAQRVFEQLTPEELGARGALGPVDHPKRAEENDDWPYRKMRKTA